MTNVGDTSKLLSSGVNDTINGSAAICLETSSVHNNTNNSNNVSSSFSHLSSPSLVNIDSQLKTGYYNVAGPQNNLVPTTTMLTPQNNYYKQQRSNNENNIDIEKITEQQQQTNKKQPKFDDSAIWGDLSMDIRPSVETLVDNDKSLSVDDAGPPSSMTSSSSISVKFKKSTMFQCRYFQWASIKTFCFLICALITVHGALATGYTYSVLTTIEKRFSVNSFIAGFVISSYELGSLLSVVYSSVILAPTVIYLVGWASAGWYCA